jgi:hypothetical protein
MKLARMLAVVALGLTLLHPPAHAQGLFDRIKQKVKDKVDEKVDKKIDETLDGSKPEGTLAAKAPESAASADSLETGAGRVGELRLQAG